MVGPTSVTVAIEVPVLGRYVVAAVYIPPVQRGYASWRYVELVADTLEAVRTLQLAWGIDSSRFTLLGDFNAHIG